MALVNNTEKNRYELTHEGQLSVITYKFTQQTQRIYLIHTEVPSTLQGQGIGNTFVKLVLDDIRHHGWSLGGCAARQRV